MNGSNSGYNDNEPSRFYAVGTVLEEVVYSFIAGNAKHMEALTTRIDELQAELFNLKEQHGKLYFGHKEVLKEKTDLLEFVEGCWS